MTETIEYEIEVDESQVSTSGQVAEFEVEVDDSHVQTLAVEDTRIFVGEVAAVIVEHSTFVHDQQVASDEWTVIHALGRYPSVTVVDSAGSWVIGDVTYIDSSTLRINFSSAFSGKAYLN